MASALNISSTAVLMLSLAKLILSTNDWGQITTRQPEIHERLKTLSVFQTSVNLIAIFPPSSLTLGFKDLDARQVPQLLCEAMGAMSGGVGLKIVRQCFEHSVIERVCWTGAAK